MRVISVSGGFLFSIYLISLLGACEWGGLNGEERELLDACYYRIEGSSKCGTSFPRLMINPESARGKEVVIAGFLAPRAGVALLYASEQDYLNGEVFNAVEIKGRDLSLLDEKWYRWVRIRAEFERSTGKNVAWFGILKNPDMAEILLPADKVLPVVIYQDVND